MEGGYSNRGRDQRYVTPFLKKHNLTACAASGAESGRNFERPFPYTLDFQGSPKGKGNRVAFLNLLHLVEEKGQDPFNVIVLLLALDMQRKTTIHYDYPEPKGVLIENIVSALVDHFKRSRGHNRSRLPVLAVYAIYMSLVGQLKRFDGMTLAPLEFHTTADLRSRKIGDIQVIGRNGAAFEGVEVKSNLRFTEHHISSLSNKFRGQPVKRYYLLTTAKEYIKEGHKKLVEQELKAVCLKTGCQVIVNGIVPSLKYYLRLLRDTEKFIKDYTELVESDSSVQVKHKEIWSRILNALSSRHS